VDREDDLEDDREQEQPNINEQLRTAASVPILVPQTQRRQHRNAGIKSAQPMLKNIQADANVCQIHA
jgi:hypothetical protein